MEHKSTEIAALFCKNVRYLCKVQNKNLGEVEKAAGVSPGYLSRESTRLRLDTAYRIADCLKAGLSVMLEYDLDKKHRIDKLHVEIMEKQMELENLMRSSAGGIENAGKKV